MITSQLCLQLLHSAPLQLMCLQIQLLALTHSPAAGASHLLLHHTLFMQPTILPAQQHPPCRRHHSAGILRSNIRFLVYVLALHEREALQLTHMGCNAAGWWRGSSPP